MDSSVFFHLSLLFFSFSSYIFLLFTISGMKRKEGGGGGVGEDEHHGHDEGDADLDVYADKPIECSGKQDVSSSFQQQ